MHALTNLEARQKINKHACECGICHGPLTGGRDTFVDGRYGQVLCINCRCEHWRSIDNRANVLLQSLGEATLQIAQNFLDELAAPPVEAYA